MHEYIQVHIGERGDRKRDRDRVRVRAKERDTQTETEVWWNQLLLTLDTRVLNF